MNTYDEYTNLVKLGWHPFFDRHFEMYRSDGFAPARVARENRSNYQIYSEVGELTAELSGKFRFHAGEKGHLPAVGDWVVAGVRPDEGRATIHALLPRRSAFSRKGVTPNTRVEQQVLAANVDYVFLVSGLDHDFNLRRIERYVATAWDSGAAPVILLNKADLCQTLDSHIERVASIAVGVPVHPVSAIQNEGLEALDQYLSEGKTVAFLGSSGVGKSSIINRFIGEERMKVNSVRDWDSHGRHTTTHRELIILPRGGIVIDTPGMREIQTWGDKDGLGRTFEDIEFLASQCRFTDCRHQTEPGCAVREGIENGAVDPGRLKNYIKQQKELKHMARRIDSQTARRETRQWDKKLHQIQKERKQISRKAQFRG